MMEVQSNFLRLPEEFAQLPQNLPLAKSYVIFVESTIFMIAIELQWKFSNEINIAICNTSID